MPSDIARSRLEHWKSRLIDLSLRNKLLNYRPRRTSAVPIVDEIPRVVVRRLLEDEKDIGFRPKPEAPVAPPKLPGSSDEASDDHEFRRVPDEQLRPLKGNHYHIHASKYECGAEVD